MSLDQHLDPNFPRYEVRCKDDIMQEHRITRGVVYTVLGKLFGFLLIKNDKGELDKVSQARFEDVE